MIFQSVDELNVFLGSLIFIGGGSQGDCYSDGKKVYKIFKDYDESDYEEVAGKDQILQFKNLKNATFIFPEDVIILGGKVIGYITKYTKANNLFQINPLTLSLDRLERLILLAIKDIKYISKNSVRCYDLMYNIMLGTKIRIVDTIDYNFSNSDEEKLLRDNLSPFNLEFMYFLVDGLFTKVVEDNKELLEMYSSHGHDINILEFIKAFRKRLSELVGFEIQRLNQAKKYLDDEPKKKKYLRALIKESIL